MEIANTTEKPLPPPTRQELETRLCHLLGLKNVRSEVYAGWGGDESETRFDGNEKVTAGAVPDMEYDFLLLLVQKLDGQPIV